MIKKIIAALSAAAILLTFCACGSKQAEEPSTEKPSVTAKDGKYLDDVAAKTFTNKKTLFTYEDAEYFAADYLDKHLVATVTKGNKVKILFEYPEKTKLDYLTETYERSGKKFLYFTKQDDGETSEALYAYYIPTMTETNVVGTPCSNFVLLDVPASYEMYAYGFIATSSVINVVNLTDGSISASYSQTLKQLSAYIEMPDTFFGKNVTTVLEQADRAHLRVKVMNGEKVKRSFLVHCALGVATEEEKAS